MTEKQNQAQETTEARGEQNAATVPGETSPSKLADSRSPSEASPESVWQKARKFFLWFLDYIRWEEPAPPPSDIPKTGWKKLWGDFNSFLDSIDEVGEAQEAQTRPLKERMRDCSTLCRSSEGRKNMWKATGDFCWVLFFRCAIVVFLLAATTFGVIWGLNFFEERHVPFYPKNREVVQYLMDEHETLEAVAFGMTTMAGKNDDIPLERFGEKCVELLHPVKAYSDEYGVYLMTSKDWYSGEHGIFIARDNNDLPPKLSWGLIKGRVYTYTFFH